MNTFVSVDVGFRHTLRLFKPIYWNSKRLNNKAFFHLNFSTARPRLSWARIPIITQPQQFVNRENEQNNHQIKSRICATLPIDFWCSLWYTIIVKREAVSNQRSGKLMAPMGDCVETGSPFRLIPAESSPEGIKKLKKPLDKSPEL